MLDLRLSGQFNPPSSEKIWNLEAAKRMGCLFKARSRLVVLSGDYEFKALWKAGRTRTRAVYFAAKGV